MSRTIEEIEAQIAQTDADMADVRQRWESEMLEPTGSAAQSAQDSQDCMEQSCACNQEAQESAEVATDKAAVADEKAMEATRSAVNAQQQAEAAETAKESALVAANSAADALASTVDALTSTLDAEANAFVHSEAAEHSADRAAQAAQDLTTAPETTIPRDKILRSGHRYIITAEDNLDLSDLQVEEYGTTELWMNWTYGTTGVVFPEAYWISSADPSVPPQPNATGLYHYTLRREGDVLVAEMSYFLLNIQI